MYFITCIFYIIYMYTYSYVPIIEVQIISYIEDILLGDVYIAKKSNYVQNSIQRIYF